MAVETGNYIDNLDDTLPAANNIVSEGDDHTRNIKSILKRMFKNMREYGSIPFVNSVSSGGSTGWDVDTNPNESITLRGDVSLTGITNARDGGVYTMRIIQDETGGRTFTFPSDWKWAERNVGVISSGANAQDILMVRRIGTDYYASLSLNWG